MTRSPDDAPLHERLSDWADRQGDLSNTDLHDEWERESQATLREAAAALRPPKGEVGALCHSLENIARWLERRSPVGRLDAKDIRAALAHLRRLGQVEAELEAEHARSCGMTIEDYRQTLIAARAALAPAPAAEPGP